MISHLIAFLAGRNNRLDPTRYLLYTTIAATQHSYSTPHTALQVYTHCPLWLTRHKSLIELNCIDSFLMNSLYLLLCRYEILWHVFAFLIKYVCNPNPNVCMDDLWEKRNQIDSNAFFFLPTNSSFISDLLMKTEYTTTNNVMDEFNRSP